MDKKHGKPGKGQGRVFDGRSVELYPILNCDYADWFIRFKKTGDGEKLVTTDIKLSGEAMEALVSLYHTVSSLQERDILDPVVDLMVGKQGGES